MRFGVAIDFSSRKFLSIEDKSSEVHNFFKTLQCRVRRHRHDSRMTADKRDRLRRLGMQTQPESRMQQSSRIMNKNRHNISTCSNRTEQTLSRNVPVTYASHENGRGSHIVCLSCRNLGPYPCQMLSAYLGCLSVALSVVLVFCMSDSLASDRGRFFR